MKGRKVHLVMRDVDKEGTRKGMKVGEDIFTFGFGQAKSGFTSRSLTPEKYESGKDRMVPSSQS